MEVKWACVYANVEIYVYMHRREIDTFDRLWHTFAVLIFVSDDLG